MVSKRIVIAGLGDAGLLSAIQLNKKFEVIGISPKPCLVSGQELGPRLARPTDWEENYLIDYDRFKGLKGVHIRHAKVSQIIADENKISLIGYDGLRETLTYDALVISSGTRNGFWRTSHFENHEDVQRNLTEKSKAILSADRLAIIGGGPTAVSVASNIKEMRSDAEVNLFFSQKTPLPSYHPRTRRKIEKLLKSQGVVLHPMHRANVPTDLDVEDFSSDPISWTSGQEPFDADLTLWAIGKLTPNNEFIPADMLTSEGFVKSDIFLRVAGYENVFTVGDIAKTDDTRSSARNAGHLILAHNVKAYLEGRSERMKPFQPPRYRWGSILGVQKKGLSIFTPNGERVGISPWWVKNLLFPIFVWRLIYQGLVKR